MIPCSICFSIINEDDQYYLFGNLGPDIISIIENELGHKVYEGTMCDNCFANAMQKISTPAQDDTMTYPTKMSPPVYEEYEFQHAYNTKLNVCVWCQRSIYKRRTHKLPKGPERRLISKRITPRDIPDGSLVCYQCWLRARRIRQQQEVGLPEKCVCCLHSFNQKRRYFLPEGPVRNAIITRIYPKEFPSDGFVCHECWASASKIAHSASNIDERHQNPVSADHHHNVFCASCGMSLFQRKTQSVPIGPETEEVAARIDPCEINVFLCTSCWAQTIENVQKKGQVQQENVHVQQPITAMEHHQFTHTTSSNSHCLVPQCTNSEVMCARLPL